MPLYYYFAITVALILINLIFISGKLFDTFLVISRRLYFKALTVL